MTLDDVTKYSTLLIPYSIMISTCYLYGYWNSFSIDFYSYISASELAIRSIAPFFSIGIVSALGFFTQFERKSEVIEAELSVQFRPTRNEIISLLGIVAISLVLLYLLQSFIVIIFSAIFVFGLILYIKLLIPSFFKLNKAYIYFLIVLPIFSFVDGKLKSTQIINGENFSYFQYKINDNSTCLENDKDQRYIGKLGEFVFIYSKSKNSVIIHEFKKTTPLILLKYPT